VPAERSLYRVLPAGVHDDPRWRWLRWPAEMVPRGDEPCEIGLAVLVRT